MRDLETRLADLGARWEAPPAPDLVPAVLAGRTATAARAPFRPRRAVLALAAAAVAIGAVAAIAPARDTVLQFFDIGGVRVVTTSTTPTAPPASGAADPMGTPITLSAARARASFALRLPTVPDAPPDQVLVQTPPEDGAYTFVWAAVDGVSRGQLTVTQFRGRLGAEKTLDPALTRIRRVAVDGVTGFWLSGGPHTLGFLDTDGTFRAETLRTVGDVLVWERAGVTHRVEGAVSLEQALRVAGSFR